MVDDVDGESLFCKVEQWWMDQNLSHINSCKHVCPLSLTTEPSCSFQRSEILGKIAQQGRFFFLVTTLELQWSNSGFIGLVSYEICCSCQFCISISTVVLHTFHNVQPPRPPKRNQIRGGKIPVPTRTRSSKHHVFSRLRIYPLLFLVEFKWIADGYNQDLRWNELMIFSMMHLFCSMIQWWKTSPNKKYIPTHFHHLILTLVLLYLINDLNINILYIGKR